MKKMTDAEMAVAIAEEVSRCGGRAYYVGGYVRDLLRGEKNIDIDLEIHGISPSCLAEILDRLGKRLEMGENFGIFSLKGYSIDIAMPRKKNGRGGYSELEDCVDPFCGTLQAASRRDFTVNAMMQDVLTAEIVDHFNGKEDLKRGVIRAVSERSFEEDPLRVLRAARFAACFGFSLAKETTVLCQKTDLKNIAKERVLAELEKALLKSPRPSVFFEILRQMGQLSVWFPELAALVGVTQNPKHHAEGDVWVHTMMVLDESVRFIPTVQNPFGFMLSALVHDCGKAICTETVRGEIHAYCHETLGLPLAEAFLLRITNEKKLIQYVLNLVEFHMKPNMLAAANSAVKASNKMFDDAIDPKALICLATADGLGRKAERAYVSHDAYLKERYELYREMMERPFVEGKDLVAAGLFPSERFAEYLTFAHKLRLAGIDKESALKQTLAFARKKERKNG